jgi:periplasmic copper chaperone A
MSGATVTKAPTSVVWTADEAHQLGQNQYQAFSLSVGRLPAEGTKVTLKAAQTYTDGNVVNWDEESAEGQPEPKHPAPSFVTTADDKAATATAASSAAPNAEAAIQTSEVSSDGASAWGVILGGAGFILGAVALGLVLAGRRTHAGAK